MRVFDIYHHPRHGLQAVRRGFSWTAFLMPSVWAVTRGLGFTTLLLVAATSLVFDVAEVAGMFVNHPLAQAGILLALALALGYKPGFEGYRWHARALQDDAFEYRCTVAAPSRRTAIRAAARNAYQNGPIRIAAP